MVQLASNETDSNFTEYVFPDSVADPVPEVDPLQEINLPEEPDAKIKYDGQLTPALLYQIHMESKSVVIVKLIFVCLITCMQWFSNMLKMGLISSQ